MASYENKQARETLIKLAVKSVLNATVDHYTKSGTQLSYDEYWKKHLSLTGVKSIDSHVQSLVSDFVDDGLTAVDTIASKVKRALGI